MAIKILTVCLGNICRSPMAEGIILHEAQKQDLPIEIDSCGTGGWHTGEKPDHRALKHMDKKGIDIHHLRARQIRKKDLQYFDHILVMDQSNYSDVLALCQDQKEAQKVTLMLSYWPECPSKEVPDPYYGGDEGFETVYNWVQKAAQEFIKTLK